jgi:hypothetical protein
MKTELKIGGIYNHYKGDRYKVVCVARHSETLEELVVYQALYGSGNLWVRPKKMFLEKVKADGKLVPRFELEFTLGDKFVCEKRATTRNKPKNK